VLFYFLRNKNALVGATTDGDAVVEEASKGWLDWIVTSSSLAASEIVSGLFLMGDRSQPLRDDDDDFM